MKSASIFSKEVLSGAGASIVVRIFGPDLAVLRKTAHDVAEAMTEVEGVKDLTVEKQVLVPQLKVQLRPDVASRLGLTPGDVRRAATTLVHGTKVGEVYEGQKIYDVAVWGVERVRSDLEALHELPVETPQGVQVPLG